MCLSCMQSVTFATVARTPFSLLHPSSLLVHVWAGLDKKDQNAYRNVYDAISQFVEDQGGMNLHELYQLCSAMDTDESGTLTMREMVTTVASTR